MWRLSELRSAAALMRVGGWAFGAGNATQLKKENGGSFLVDSRTAGSTGMTVVLDGCDMHICSVGDSRVVLGRVEGKSVVVVAASEVSARLQYTRWRIRIEGGSASLCKTLPSRRPERHRRFCWDSRAVKTVERGAQIGATKPLTVDNLQDKLLRITRSAA